MGVGWQQRIGHFWLGGGGKFLSLASISKAEGGRARPPNFCLGIGLKSVEGSVFF